MSDIVFRELTGEEIIEHAAPLDQMAYSRTPADLQLDRWQEHLPFLAERYYVAAFDGDQAVATANNLNLTQNVRSHIYKVGGIAGVAVHPSHRRQGLAWGVVQKCFENDLALDHVFSNLYPFRESFYERLGYVTFPQRRIVALNIHALVPLLKQDLPGVVELLPIADGYDAFRKLVVILQPQTHGFALVTEQEDKRLKVNNKYWSLVARHDNQVVGVMLYTNDGYTGNFSIRRFYYRNGIGKYLLLNWIARHVDQNGIATMVLRPDEYVETWFPDLEAEVKSPLIRNNTSPTPMGRVLQVAKIGGMQTGTGRFTARIEDPQCDWNNGVWTFETVDGRLRVEPGDVQDCTLTINGLSALAYGVGDPGDFQLRGWGNPSEDLQAVMRRMFSPQTPYLHEYF